MLKIFEFGDRAVRVLGTTDKPMFVAKDVCGILGLRNSSQAISRLDADEKGVISNDPLSGKGGKQKTAIITESGLYALILQSRKKEAKAFRRWVTSEVLPAIRKTGAYQAENAFGGEMTSVIEFLDKTPGGLQIGPPLMKFVQHMWRIARMAKMKTARGPRFGFESVELWPQSFLQAGYAQWTAGRLESEPAANRRDFDELVRLLVADHGSFQEIRFEKIYTVSCTHKLFAAWTQDLTPAVKSALGKFLASQGGRTIDLPHGRKCKWRVYGANRSRRFMLEILDSRGEVASPAWPGMAGCAAAAVTGGQPS